MDYHARYLLAQWMGSLVMGMVPVFLLGLWWLTRNEEIDDEQ